MKESTKKAIAEMHAKIEAGDPRCPIAVGSRVEKINSEPDDYNPDGTKGTVRGSWYSEEYNTPCYFVEWDGFVMPDNPRNKVRVQVEDGEDGEDEETEYLYPYLGIIGTKVKQV